MMKINGAVEATERIHAGVNGSEAKKLLSMKGI
jgi:hypothetical protein